MYKLRNLFATPTGVIVLVLTMFAAGAVNAAPINYGDFIGSTVMYLDVTETAITPGDQEPLFGAPSIAGNQLDFDPKGFAASAPGAVADITDGQMNFVLRALPGSVLKTFSISERGDYSLFGTGNASTQVIYGVGVSSISVLEVDGVAVVPVALTGASVSGSDDLSNGLDVVTPWSLSLTYDITAALGQAGIGFTVGATRLEIVLDNTLGAVAQSSSVAHIAKKDFTFLTTTSLAVPRAGVVPLPGAALFIVSGLAGLAGFGRLQSRRCSDAAALA